MRRTLTGFQMSGDGQQPAYDVNAPGIGLRRISDTEIEIELTPPEGKRGRVQSLRVSEFNAWRLFGLLGLALGITLTRQQGRIRL